MISVNNEILSRVERIFQKVFANNDIVLTPKSTANDIAKWDSLTHMELIATIEEEFKIKFSFQQVLGFRNVGDIINCIEKLQGK